MGREGGQVISLLWKVLSDGCAETNCVSMQNGGITFIFINKDFLFFRYLFANIGLFLSHWLKRECSVIFEIKRHVLASVNKVVSVVGTLLSLEKYANITPDTMIWVALILLLSH